MNDGKIIEKKYVLSIAGSGAIECDRIKCVNYGFCDKAWMRILILTRPDRSRIITEQKRG